MRLSFNPSSRVGALECARPGCQQPPWNGQPGEYCSCTCRDWSPPAAPTPSWPPPTPIAPAAAAAALLQCARLGCHWPPWNGQPGEFCSLYCQGLAGAPAAAPVRCANPSCGRPPWNGQAGEFCSHTCRRLGGGGGPPSPTGSLPGAVQCARPGCSELAWNGQQGEFCSRACRRQGGGAAPPATSRRSAALCAHPGCTYPTWNGQAGEFCSWACREAAAGQGRAAPAGPSCRRAGCRRPPWNGAAGQFCSRSCLAASQAGGGAPAGAAAGPGAGAAAAEVELLLPHTQKYRDVEKQFREKWQPRKTWGWDVSRPNIDRIYQLNLRPRRPDYDQCQQAWLQKKRRGDNGAGNEARRFHGTQLKCRFTNGVPCNKKTCTVCRIIRDGKFLLRFAGKGSSPGHFGDGLYFTSCSHTAKGYGVPDQLRWPNKLFAKHDAGNAMFIATVLVGDAEVTTAPGGSYSPGKTPAMTTPDLTKWGFDSRVVNKSNGVDELIIFTEKQALPRYLIIFGP